MNRFVNDDLIRVLNQLAQSWTTDAEQYQRRSPNGQLKERAFFLGMSCGFADSANELLKLLRLPTIEGVITLAHLLDQRQIRAAYKSPYRRRALNIKAHRDGTAEAYKRCADNLMMALVEILRNLTSPVDYLC